MLYSMRVRLSTTFLVAGVSRAWEGSGRGLGGLSGRARWRPGGGSSGLARALGIDLLQTLFEVFVLILKLRQFARPVAEVAAEPEELVFQFPEPLLDFRQPPLHA